MLQHANSFEGETKIMTRHGYVADDARFLQEDPIWFDAGDLNVYRMTWNNPVNWTDPSGMSAAGERAGLGAISAGLASGLTLHGTR